MISVERQYQNEIDELREQLAAKDAEIANWKRQAPVIAEILDIMRVYHEQEKRREGVGTPGGLEHMGDVWSMFQRWEKALAATPPAKPACAHNVNPATDRCVMCGKNRFNRELEEAKATPPAKEGK